MHQLLTGLQASGLVSAVGEGRSQRYALTAEGRTCLREGPRPSQQSSNA